MSKALARITNDASADAMDMPGRAVRRLAVRPALARRHGAAGPPGAPGPRAVSADPGPGGAAPCRPMSGLPIPELETGGDVRLASSSPTVISPPRPGRGVRALVPGIAPASRTSPRQRARCHAAPPAWALSRSDPRLDVGIADRRGVAASLRRPPGSSARPADGRARSPRRQSDDRHLPPDPDRHPRPAGPPRRAAGRAADPGPHLCPHPRRGPRPARPGWPAAGSAARARRPPPPQVPGHGPEGPAPAEGPRTAGPARTPGCRHVLQPHPPPQVVCLALDNVRRSAQQDREAGEANHDMSRPVAEPSKDASASITQTVLRHRLRPAPKARPPRIPLSSGVVVGRAEGRDLRCCFSYPARRGPPPPRLPSSPGE